MSGNENRKLAHSLDIVLSPFINLCPDRVQVSCFNSLKSFMNVSQAAQCSEGNVGIYFKGEQRFYKIFLKALASLEKFSLLLGQSGV